MESEILKNSQYMLHCEIWIHAVPFKMLILQQVHVFLSFRCLLMTTLDWSSTFREYVEKGKDVTFSVTSPASLVSILDVPLSK